MRATREIAFLGWLVVAGCGGKEPVGLPDGRPGDGRGAVDAAPRSWVLQSVVNKIVLPTSSGEYAVDLDGNGTKDNQLGVIIGAMKALPLGSYDFQSNIDFMIGNGTFILLMAVLGHSLVEDSAAQLQGLLGADLDNPPDPKDNFSGSELLAVSSSSPQDLFLDGVITAGKLKAGPGTLVGPLPTAAGTAPQLVSFRRAEVTADLGPAGIASGIIRGGIPWAEVDQKFIPMIAAEASTTLKDPSAPKNVTDALTLAFDTNADGIITPDEIRQSQLLKLVLKPDVDLDGDKTPDGLSLAIAFSAVPCVIKR